MPGWRFKYGINKPSDVTLIFGNGPVHKQRYSLQFLSITVVLLKNDTPEGFFDRMQDFMKQHFVSGFIGVEVGPRENNRHLQCWASVYGTLTKPDLQKAVSDAIKAALLKPRGLSVTVRWIKPEDKKYVLGYCQKDSGRVG